MEIYKIWIYALKDPRDNSFKYVGMTKNPTKRLYDHIHEKKGKTKKINWIKKLIKLNLLPLMIILDETNNVEVEKMETYYIKKLIKLNLLPLMIILDETNNVEVEKMETYYIKKLIDEGNELLNYDENGIGTAKKINKETINTLRKKNIKKVIRYNLNGKKIDEFISLREAERITGINHGNISKCCTGKYKHSGGFIFKFENDECNYKIINPNAIKKKVIEVDINGNLINEYNSITEASKKTDIDQSNISKICNGKLKKSNNKYFKFKEID